MVYDFIINFSEEFYPLFYWILVLLLYRIKL